MENLKFNQGEGFYKLKAFLNSDENIWDVNQLICVKRPQFILEDRIKKGNYYRIILTGSDLYLIKCQDGDVRQYIYLYDDKDKYWCRFFIKNQDLYFENAPLNDIRISDFSKNRNVFKDLKENNLKKFIGKSKDVYLIGE